MEKKRPELFSISMAAGSRTYFFDVKESVNGNKYLKISESRRDPEGEFEHSRVMVYEEHIEQFLEGLKQAVQLMTQEEKAYSVERIRLQHPKAYARWTEEEFMLSEKRMSRAGLSTNSRRSSADKPVESNRACENSALSRLPKKCE
jgi:hypothetical protein